MKPASAILVSTALLWLAAAAQAQTGPGYDASHNVIAGGGTTSSTGNGYAKGSTIGQAALGTASGPTYVVTGGFWAGMLLGANLDRCANVTCSALDVCHVVGTCDPGSGVCSNPSAPNGSACNDGNGCTTSDVCDGGVCGGTGCAGDATCSGSGPTASCTCNSGFSGNGFTCSLAACPAHAGGPPSCVCNSGYTGALTWNGSSWSGTCTACVACASWQYESTACTVATNRVCSACATCAAGSFQSAACTATANTQCTTCPAGQVQPQPEQTSCTPCPAGTQPDIARAQCVVPPPPPPPDSDRDGTPDSIDNCPFAANPDQQDGDGDGVGDTCDNCPTVFNPAQSDVNDNGIGDVCDTTAPVPAGLTLKQVKLKATGPNRNNGTILVQGTFDASELVGAFGSLDTALQDGLTVGLIGAGLPALQEIVVRSPLCFELGFGIRCIGTGGEEVSFRRTRVSNLFNLKLTAKNRPFAPPLTSAGVRVVLSAGGLDRQDQAASCRVLARGRSVTCKK